MVFVSLPYIFPGVSVLTCGFPLRNSRGVRAGMGADPALAMAAIMENQVPTQKWAMDGHDFHTKLVKNQRVTIYNIYCTYIYIGCIYYLYVYL